MSGNLYQLRSKRKMHPGEEFHVNGPYDRWGVVVKSDHKPGNTAEVRVNGEWLNLIRGTGHQRPGE